PQSTVIATAIAGSNSALAMFLLTRDIRVPYTGRLFFDMDLALSTYGTIQSYISGNPDFAGERAGSNGSDQDNYVEGDGNDNLVRVTFKYLLPMGDGRDLQVRPPVLERGLPVEGSGEVLSWNPLETGKIFVEVKPYWRAQSIDSDYGTFDQKTNGGAFSLYRENTDFPRNPSEGSTVRLRYTQDWGWFDSSRPYYVGEFEFSKYVSLGPSERFRRRVLAFDFWTANAFSWERTSMEDGEEVYQRPPAYLGATLGGLWRMRGFPTSRFNDQAAVYYAAEYRVIPEWNPFAGIDLLQRYLGIAWWQWVAFAEAGRVAPVWTVGELHSAMKWDGGIGIRAMAKGIVVRVDIAGSKEGFGVNMMVGQPFQF
ncbi:MAG: BamA/TamA family outer membrane protein, partial [Desulfobacterota bacterium]|nr:BamA/TamA family outer membrane protein [Thermodesulfobacteriota bacterium]